MSNYLQEMIDKLEREAFEKAFGPINDGWLHLVNPFIRHAEFYLNDEVNVAWAAWQARAKLQRPCRGVAHPNCQYHAVCGSVCNKCGQSV